MICLPIFKIAVWVCCVVTTEAHTSERGIPSPTGCLVRLMPVSALFLDSSSHTYGTQSQHLQPGFPPVRRVRSLRFPGHEHQGATLFCALCLPLGQQRALGGVSYLRTTQVAFGSVGGCVFPLVVSAPSKKEGCGNICQTFSECPALGHLGGAGS